MHPILYNIHSISSTRYTTIYIFVFNVKGKYTVCVCVCVKSLDREEQEEAEDWQPSALAIRVSNLSGELFSGKLNTNEVSLLQLKVNDYKM